MIYLKILRRKNNFLTKIENILTVWSLMSGQGIGSIFYEEKPDLRSKISVYCLFKTSTKNNLYSMNIVIVLMKSIYILTLYKKE